MQNDDAAIAPEETSGGQTRSTSKRLAGLLCVMLISVLAGCATVEQIFDAEAPPTSAATTTLSPEASQQRARAKARRPGIAALRAAFRRPGALPESAVARPEVIALGEKLFRSRELSRQRRVSCLSCHLPEVAWADLKAKPAADNGVPMMRRSQTLYDLAWQTTFLWDGRQDSLEGVVKGAVASPDIMGLAIASPDLTGRPVDDMVQRLAFKSDFAADFARVYPDIGVTPETIANALASFMRTIRSPATRFDRWVSGDDRALSPSELRGFRLFNGKANCFACHSGWRFTDDGFRDIGLPASNDRGRGRIKPQIESLSFAFRTPTLRGVADRPPYMHDGSLRSLEAVIEHYDRGGTQRASLSPDMFPLGLDAQEKADLVAFMRSLSSKPAAPETP
jgi:cytochrome c peroxidase